MLVCESMEACISICTCVESSICRSSHLIPSTTRSLVRVLGRGRGSGSEARLGVTVRGVVTTTLMMTRVATSIPGVQLGLLRVSLRCSHGLLCCLHMSSPASARWSYKVVARLFHPIKLQCKTFTRVQLKAWVR
jgi:hypothetical protein